MSSADAVIATLRTGHDSLAELVSKLSEDDLARPSGAAEWDISQVLSHLGSGAEIAQTTVQAALDGKPNPGGDFNVTVWDRWNAMTRRQRADGFLQASHTQTGLYESLDAGTRESLRIDVGFMPAPVDVATAARLRLSELTLHSWDVRVGFDEHATLPPDATNELLHQSPDLLEWIGKAELLDGKHAVIQVTTSGPASVFALRLNARISADFDVPEKPDGTLTLPAEAWLRLVAGRLAPQHTPSGVVTTGAADIELLRRVFPGY
ncbi:maleylpyruvate isomerase family mycothiol-dependent enzyme [Nonomuraea basaltis]|uniref:maleylpyruvate isomerase family mycothiol-dependent enzyme n=1 Tax=Nonomuraea basaltis TaxID=2495887 RepID=UPI00110C46B1|nr:maleylpyruvate isomerase family mycothiol-dependent enzyme [Nonomuraea basaltis]TMR94998.1 maleylpyruvate isomerase family mycothiol-dependent enzyme [Nonomuraea basaltis]